MTIVQQLVRQLPPEYTAEPRVHLGTYFEIDVCAYEDDLPKAGGFASDDNAGGVARACP
jgi:hypothetical protein